VLNLSANILLDRFHVFRMHLGSEALSKAIPPQLVPDILVEAGWICGNVWPE